MTNTSLLELISTKIKFLSSKQKQIASFIIANHTESAFLGMAQPANASGVGQATVVRFVNSLGFSSFVDFQNELQLDLKKRLFSLVPYNGKQYKDEVLTQVFSLEKSILDETLNAIDGNIFNECIEKISLAPEIVIIGDNTTVCLTHYFQHFLSILLPKVHCISGVNIGTFSELANIHSESIVFAFSFPRYSMDVIKLVDYFAVKKMHIIGIVDSYLSPISSKSTFLFRIPQKFLTFVQPFASAMVLIHAIVQGVYMRDVDSNKKKIELYDLFVKQHELVFFKDMKISDFNDGGFDCNGD